MITVQKVEDNKDFKDFFGFPWKVYKDDPNWVPPLLSMHREKLDKHKNPSWQYLEGDYYLARKNGEAAGTIAAFVNKRHNEFHQEHIAWFGMFECINDEEVAHALLETAAQWAQQKGYAALRGPQTFTNMDECGLLVEGFTRPILLMPYNPPYYQTLLEQAGFHKVMDTHSFYSNWDTVTNSDTRQRFERLVARVTQRHSITVRGLNPKNLKKEFELFRQLYNTAWEKNWGFVPFTPAELDALVEGLGMFFDPKLACFAYVDGEPAGFVLSVPDLGQVLQAAYARPGEPEILTMVKALWHWKLHPVIDWLRVPLMGVKAEHRNKGVEMVMFDYTLKAFATNPRYKHLDSGWVLETNQAMMQLAKNLGMEPYKTYRFYERSLSSTK